MLAITIEWYSPAERLPEESGEYLVKYEIDMISTLPFSKKHKAFNVVDEFDKKLAQRHKVTPCYWAKFPEFKKNESEGV